MLLLHPLLLSVARGNLGLLTGLDVPWHIWVGKGALALVLVQILVALYVCGPPGMAESILKALDHPGVSGRRIRQEIFTFID